jgi:hypothetical protein
MLFLLEVVVVEKFLGKYWEAKQAAPPMHLTGNRQGYFDLRPGKGVGVELVRLHAAIGASTFAFAISLNFH